MLDLESAIKHCEEVAYQNKILMKRYDDASGYNRSHNEKSEHIFVLFIFCLLLLFKKSFLKRYGIAVIVMIAETDNVSGNRC